METNSLDNSNPGSMFWRSCSCFLSQATQTGSPLTLRSVFVPQNLHGAIAKDSAQNTISNKRDILAAMAESPAIPVVDRDTDANTGNATSHSSALSLPDAFSEAPLHAAIAKLAYMYWEQRGRPDGSPQEDWFRAEHELRATVRSE
jgi:hypothetical protein